MTNPTIKVLITRLENAIYQEADGEFRDISFAGLKRRAEAVNAARQALLDEIEHLQQQATEPPPATPGRE